MTERLEAAAREAIEAALCTMRTLGEESGVHHVTLARWRSALTGTSPDAARKLALAIRERSLRMLDAAARLDAIVDEHKGATDE